MKMVTFLLRRNVDVMTRHPFLIMTTFGYDSNKIEPWPACLVRWGLNGILNFVWCFVGMGSYLCCFVFGSLLLNCCICFLALACSFLGWINFSKPLNWIKSRSKLSPGEILTKRGRTVAGVFFDRPELRRHQLRSKHSFGFCKDEKTSKCSPRLMKQSWGPGPLTPEQSWFMLHLNLKKMFQIALKAVGDWRLITNKSSDQRKSEWNTKTSITILSGEKRPTSWEK